MSDIPDPPAEHVIRFGAATHTGQVRTENEDNFIAEPTVFGVVDGMGGHQAGEVASHLAATILRERLASGVPNLDVVVAAVLEANAAIFQAAHANQEQRGMGTTLTALVLLRADETHGDRLGLINVGDSRTYLLRSGRLRRATIDHSYVQELVATGHITEDEARSHPRRNIVTRALGIEPTVRVDTWQLPLVRGDRFILCSDGLVDEVHDAEIADVVNAMVDPQEAADALVALANEQGGRDNVTVVVVDVIDGVEPPLLADDTDLDALPMWGGDQTGSTLIDADQPLQSLLGVPVVADFSAAATAPAAFRRRRFTLGTFLFLLAIAVILTVTITLIAVALHNSDTPATTTTTTTTSTSTTTSSTVPETTTTRALTTTTIASTSSSSPATVTSAGP